MIRKYSKDYNAETHQIRSHPQATYLDDVIITRLTITERNVTACHCDH